eukprot:600219-Rhodomonas_salina.1
MGATRNDFRMRVPRRRRAAPLWLRLNERGVRPKSHASSYPGHLGTRVRSESPVSYTHLRAHETEADL